MQQKSKLKRIEYRRGKKSRNQNKIHNVLQNELQNGFGKGIVSMQLLFEWDETKNHHNLLKHGIDFQTAAHVFADNNRIEIFDRYHSGEEDRFITIGKVHRVLFVVYTERNERIRIISARLADRKEREVYDEGAND